MAPGVWGRDTPTRQARVRSTGATPPVTFGPGPEPSTDTPRGPSASTVLSPTAPSSPVNPVRVRGEQTRKSRWVVGTRRGLPDTSVCCGRALPVESRVPPVPVSRPGDPDRRSCHRRAVFSLCEPPPRPPARFPRRSLPGPPFRRLKQSLSFC